jgi:hypothetical protein
MQRVYVTTALAGHHVGLLPIHDQVSVWFYQMLLGTFRPGPSASVQPIRPSSSLPELSPGNTGSVTR